MATYDPESMLIEVETLLKNNLNTKIAAINTEKADSITLANVGTSAYLLDMDDKISNYNPAILLTISDYSSNGIGPATSLEINVNVALLLNDNGADPNIVKKMLRYQRALMEVVQENFGKKMHTDIYRIQALPVLSFQRSNQSQRFKVVGIDIETTIA